MSSRETLNPILNHVGLAYSRGHFFGLIPSPSYSVASCPVIIHRSCIGIIDDVIHSKGSHLSLRTLLRNEGCKRPRGTGATTDMGGTGITRDKGSGTGASCWAGSGVAG
jgi:hypothetical protein